MSGFESTVEQAAVELLRGLGYAYLPGSELGDERERTTEVVLAERLRRAVARINPHLPEDNREELVRQVLQPPTASVEENNRRFHRALSRGVRVTRSDDRRGDLGWLVDFADPDANDWLVVGQLSVRGPEKLRRPDLVVYLNGMPVAVFELKDPGSPEATLEQAWSQLQEYKTLIPALFDSNEVLVISDGVEARAGSLTAGFEWFGPWKSVDGEPPQPATRSTLERLLTGLFHRRRFLDYLRHYVVWESGARVKKIAGYHQFHGVRKVVEATVERYVEGGDRRVGVVWHTQGSGKSVSMLFAAGQLVRRPEMENPTLLILSDRADLDDQLFNQFAAARDLLPAPVQAESGEHLRELLSVASGGIVFSTLQMFSTREGRQAELLSERRNVLVIADEAHRSHYDFETGLAHSLDTALPNALRLGFTGTPIEFADRSTRGVFGDVIDAYPMSQSVADGATVPLHYEGRLNRVALLRSQLERIDSEVAEAVGDLPEPQQRRLQQEATSLERILGHPDTLAVVANDLVRHWERRRSILTGKALIATPRREIAVSLYERLVGLRPEWHSDDDAEGRVKVIFSDGRERPGAGLKPHLRDPRAVKAIERRFKDPDDPLELAIVVDMWLTGFDVPPAHTLYLYKSMHGHTLMQAIARVNRVWGDKPAGLIVDYVGLGEELERAVGAYGGYAAEPLAIPVEERLRALTERFEVVDHLFHGFDYQPFFTAAPSERIRVLSAAVEHLLGLDDGEERFLDAMTTLGVAAGAALHLDEARELREPIAFFQAVRHNLRKYTVTDESEATVGRIIAGRELERRREVLRRIVVGSIASEGVIDIFEAAGLPKPDVSILSDDFLRATQRNPYKNLQIELLRKLLEDEIRARRSDNLVQARKFSELLERALNRYRNKSLQAAQVILELIELARQVRDAPQRGERLGLSREEAAFYDALADHEGVEEVMSDETLADIARELVESIRRSVTIDWTQKETVRAKMRARVKRLLRRRGYPPDQQAKAVETVLDQATALCRDWGEQNGRGAEPEPPPRIVRDADGVPQIAGANTKVVELISTVRAYGGTPQELHEELPHLSVAQIEAALAFYEDHKQEIDEDIERRLRTAERWRRETGQPPVVEKLRRLRGHA